MGASISRIYSQLPTFPRFQTFTYRQTTTAIAMPSPTHTSQPLSTPIVQPSTRSVPLTIPPVSASLHEAESEMITHLTANYPSFQYEKRTIPIYLSSNLSSPVQMNIISAGSKTSPHIFLLSGWGGGAAFYSLNLPGLCEKFRVHIIDWPGFGASSRPHYDVNWDVHQSESYFLDALEQLIFYEFEKYEDTFKSTSSSSDNPKDNINIIAHSLGGYLSAEFALRHKHKVKSLVLVSPIGIPEKPKLQNNHKRFPLMKRLIFQIIFYLWDLGLTPQLLFRMFPKFIGMHLSKLIVSSRFLVHNNALAMQSIINYFYQISAAPCAAELSLSTILESGAYAKKPLCNRLEDLNVSNLVFLYGDRDWNSANAAKEVCQKITSKNPNVNTQLIIAPDAGHHLYFDNYQFFNKVVTDTCSS